MKKNFKKYFIISFIFTFILLISVEAGTTRNCALPIYILKFVASILAVTIICMPVIALQDLLIVQSSKALFKDFKYGNKERRILIIIVAIIILVRDDAIWTQ